MLNVCVIVLTAAVIDFLNCVVCVVMNITTHVKITSYLLSFGRSFVSKS